MNLTVVGLPLTRDSVTKEFLEFVDKKNIIILTSSAYIGNLEKNNDYVTAKVGCDLLFKKHTNIISLNLWYQNGRRLSCQEVHDKLCDVVSKYNQRFPDTECFYIVPGSPLFGDCVSEILINNGTKIINTKSSKQLVKEMFPGKSSVFQSIGKAYNLGKERKREILFSMFLYRKIYEVRLGENTTKKELGKIEFLNMLKDRTEDMNSAIYIFTDR